MRIERSFIEAVSREKIIRMIENNVQRECERGAS